MKRAKQLSPPLQLTRAQENSEVLQEWEVLVAHPELQRQCLKILCSLWEKKFSLVVFVWVHPCLQPRRLFEETKKEHLTT